MRYSYFILLVLFFVSCKKTLNEIPEYCFEQEKVELKINGAIQVSDGEIFQGVNLNEMYAVKPDGEWSISIENSKYIFSANAQPLLSQEKMEQLSHQEWKTFVLNNGQYQLPNSSYVQQVILQDIEKNILLDIDQLKMGAIVLKYEKINSCEFMHCQGNMELINNDTSYSVSFKFQSAITTQK